VAGDVYEKEFTSAASIGNEQFYLTEYLIRTSWQLHELEFPDVDYIGSEHLRRGELARAALFQFTLLRTIIFCRAHP